MNNLVLSTLVIGLLGVGSIHGQERPNFAGIWVKDMTSSPPGDLVTLNITDTPALVIIERTAGGQTEQLSFSFVGQAEALTISAAKDEVGGPTIVQTAKATWHDGHLDTYIERVISGKTVTQNIRYRLAPDGSRMTVERDLQIHHGYEGQKASATTTAAEIYIKNPR